MQHQANVRNARARAPDRYTPEVHTPKSRAERKTKSTPTREKKSPKTIPLSDLLANSKASKELVPADITTMSQRTSHPIMPVPTLPAPPPAQVIIKDPEKKKPPVDVQPLVLQTDASSIMTRHIPNQKEIAVLLNNIRRRYIRQWHVPISLQSLIQAYKDSPRFHDVYLYITRNQLPPTTKQADRLRLDALNYFVAGGLLLRLVPNLRPVQELYASAILVIPEKLETDIFNMYHASTLASHQGFKRTFLTISKNFYIPNLRTKLQSFIRACDVCQLAQKPPPTGKASTTYAKIPLSYIPMSNLAVDVKYMPKTQTGYEFLLVVVCEYTNFTILIPLKQRTAEVLAAALYDRVICIFGLPTFLNIDEDAALTGKVITTLLTLLKIDFRVVSPVQPRKS